MKRFITTLAITMCFVGCVYAQHNEQMSELKYRLNHICDFESHKVSDSVPSIKKVNERPLSAKESVSDTKRELTDGSVYTKKGGRWVKTPMYDIDFKNGDKVGSIGNVCRQLGYYSGEYIYYCTNDSIGCVVINLFTEKIICLYFNNEKHKYDCEVLDDWIAFEVIDNRYKKFLQKLTELPFSYRIDKACGKNAISMSRVENDLNTKALNNVVTDGVHQMKYTFKDGFLVNYETFSGFNIRVEEFKGRTTFNKVYANAKKYYSDNDDAVKYVNRQFDDMFAMNTAHVKMATNLHINYNFSLVYAFDKGEDVSESDFRFIAPEVTDKVVNGDKTIYTHEVGMCFVFVNGKLTDTYMKN